MFNDRSIAKRLQLLIDNLGITQKELAEKANITEAAVSRYIQGSRIPNAGTIISICRATNVSPNWLLGSGDDNVMERL